MSCAFRQFQSCQREWRPYLFHISMWYYPRIHALERRYNLGVPIHESKKVAPKRQMNCDCMAWMGRDWPKPFGFQFCCHSTVVGVHDSSFRGTNQFSAQTNNRELSWSSVLLWVLDLCVWRSLGVDSEYTQRCKHLQLNESFLQGASLASIGPHVSTFFSSLLVAVRTCSIAAAVDIFTIGHPWMFEWRSVATKTSWEVWYSKANPLQLWIVIIIVGNLRIMFGNLGAIPLCFWIVFHDCLPFEDIAFRPGYASRSRVPSRLDRSHGKLLHSRDNKT
jgi:hypothetical protein